MTAISPEISQVLAQMRTLTAQAQGTSSSVETSTAATASFSELLAKSVNSVNDLQKEAGALKTAFEMGDPQIDLTQVMIASEKSGLAFQAMTQVRNKLLQAYKDVMSMPV